MKKKLFYFICAIFLTTSLWAEADIKFKDLDDNHWASKSIYNMVRLGITRGYPDGTFRGKKTLNRQETMVFLNNLTIALEKMIDEKIEEAMFLGEDTMSNRAVEELKVEIETLKEQLLAMEAGSAGSGGKGRFKITVDMDNYISQRVVDWSTDFTENEYYQRLRLFVSSNINENVGFKAGLDTNYVDWASTRNLDNGLIEGDLWAKKRFNSVFEMSFRLTKGPGQVKMANKKVYERNGDSIAIGMDLYGVNLDIAFSAEGVTGDFDIDGNGTADNLRVNRFSPKIYYTIPMPLPYLGLWTIGFGMDQYATEKNRVANDILRSTRFSQTNTFKITDKITWKTKHVKELSYVPTVNTDGDPIHNEAQGIYYDTSLVFGDLFNSGTRWTIMHAYKGDGFGDNGLLEDAPGINLLGYESCGYFSDDWEGNNRTPSGDITTETGIRIVQDLYQGKVLLGLTYISGVSIPGDSDDNTKYRYNLSGFDISWIINDVFTTYIGIEQKIIDDSSIEDNDDQYSDSTGFLGMRVAF